MAEMQRATDSPSSTYGFFESDRLASPQPDAVIALQAAFDQKEAQFFIRNPWIMQNLSSLSRLSSNHPDVIYVSALRTSDVIDPSYPRHHPRNFPCCDNHSRSCT